MTHHDHGERPHPPATLSLSLLRLSAAHRLAVAGVLIVLMWAAALWAIGL
jgi:hypothetical protein